MFPSALTRRFYFPLVTTGSLRSPVAKNLRPAGRKGKGQKNAFD